MTITRRLLALALLASIAGCGEPWRAADAADPALPHATAELLAARIRIADQPEIALEVTTKPDQRVLPIEPPDAIAGFELLDWRALPIVREPGRWHHRFRVRLRAREIGAFVWPALRIAVAAPGGGSIEVALPPIPLRVDSILGEHPHRTEPFGVRAAPAPAAPTPLPRALVGAAAVLGLAVFTFLLVARRRARRRHVRPDPPPPPWNEALDTFDRAARLAHDPADPAGTGTEAPRSSPGPWPDLDGSATRRVEGVEAAVAWRLAALAPEVRRAWTLRFEPVAAAALVAAGREPGPLAAVEREHPGTPSAARAALLLADSELEAGRLHVARSWCERGQHHLPEPSALEEGGERLRKALLARRRLCDELVAEAEKAPARGPGASRRGRAEGEPQAWHQATGLVAIETRVFGAPPARGFRPPGLGAGVQPGLAFLDNDQIALQRPDRILWLEGREGTVTYGLRWNTLLAEAGLIVRSPHASGPGTGPPGWPMVPVTDGRLLVCVHGRADGGNANALVCMETPEPPRPGSLAQLGTIGGIEGPRVRWIVHGDRTLAARGEETPWPSAVAGLLEPDGEIQPGPVIVGSRVFVQVRRGGQAPGRTPAAGSRPLQSWLLALDLETGRPLWKRYLARGIELSRDLGRMSFGDVQRTAGQPLLLSGETVFCGTHLGAAALVDHADGRLLWSVLSRRRDAARTTWTGSAPAPGSDALLWAPADSDHLYWLAPGAAPAGSPSRAPFLHPPRALGEAEALIGGGADEALVLSRAGLKRTLSAWDASSGGRKDALYLAPEEAFAGAGAAAPGRVLFATDRGVYLFDRTRELALLDFEPLRGGWGGGGDVIARGDRIYVVGREALWILGVE